MPGTELTLNASGANSFEWSTGETTPSIDIIVMKDTTVMLTATNGLSCTLDTTFTILTDSIACSCDLSIVNVGTPSTCDPATNTYSVQVEVNHENAIGDSLMLNGQLFAYESSPQTVVLSGLNSDGQIVDLYLRDQLVSSCSDTSIAAFVAPESCMDTLEIVIDTVYVTVEETDSLINICLNDQLQLPNGVGSSAICANGTIADVSTGDDECIEISIEPSTLTESDTLCVVHCDSIDNSICDSTYIVLIPDSQVCPELSIMASNENPCLGEEISLSIEVSMAESIQWSTGENSTEILAAPGVSTTYTVNVLYLDGCSVSDSITINPLAIPEVSITADRTEVCAGEKVILTASGASDYVWSTGETAISIEVSPNDTTEYFVQGFDGNNCSDDASIEIMVVPNDLVALISPLNPITCNQPVRLEVFTNGSSVEWSTGENTPVVFVSPNVTTAYSVEASNDQGCTLSVDVTVMVNCDTIETRTDTVHVEISDDVTEYCVPDEFLEVENISQLLFCGQGNMVTGTTIGTGNPCIFLNTNIETFIGPDTICVQHCDQLVCDQTIIIITKDEFPVKNDTVRIDLIDSVLTYDLCLDDEIDVPLENTATGICELSNADSIVFKNDIQCISISIPESIISLGDTLCVEHCNMDINKCDQTIIILNPVVPEQLENDTVIVQIIDDSTLYQLCFNENILEDPDFDDVGICDEGSIDVSFAGDSSCVDLSLDPETFTYGDTVCILHCSSGICDTTTIILLPVRPITEEIVLIVKDSTIELQQCLDQELQLFGPIESQIGCGDGVEASINSFDRDSCFTVLIENENGLSQNDTLCVLQCDNNVCDTTYIVLVPGNPPIAVDDVVEIESGVGFVTIPVLDSDSDPDGDTIVIVDITIQPQQGTASINSDGTVSYEPGEDFFSDSFEYAVCDESVDGQRPYHGCDTAWVYVSLKNFSCDPPEAFSPNGDGKNEKFVIPCLRTGGAETRRADLCIYNRWGNQVYANENYNNDWDGTYKDSPLPAGTYYYVLSIIEENGEESKQSGFIVVHR